VLFSSLFFFHHAAAAFQTKEVNMRDLYAVSFNLFLFTSMCVNYITAYALLGQLTLTAASRLCYFRVPFLERQQSVHFESGDILVLWFGGDRGAAKKSSLVLAAGFMAHGDDKKITCHFPIHPPKWHVLE
ncbi:hypothetical protein ACJX0J_009373, partial [Zea mays]